MTTVIDRINQQLNGFINRVYSHSTLHQLKQTLIQILVDATALEPRHFKLDIRAKHDDPNNLLITPMNVLTGMVLMGIQLPPYYLLDKLLESWYEDHTGTYQVSQDDYGDPCFSFNPQGRGPVNLYDKI